MTASQNSHHRPNPLLYNWAVTMAHASTHSPSWNSWHFSDSSHLHQAASWASFSAAFSKSYDSRHRYYSVRVCPASSFLQNASLLPAILLAYRWNPRPFLGHLLVVTILAPTCYDPYWSLPTWPSTGVTGSPSHTFCPGFHQRRGRALLSILFWSAFPHPTTRRGLPDISFVAVSIVASFL